MNRGKKTSIPNKTDDDDLLKARALMQKKQYTRAIELLKNKLSETPNDIQTIIMLADATSMANGGIVEGPAYELIKKALTLNPKHPTALWLAGMAEYRIKNYNKALSHWKTLDKILLKNSPDSIELKSLITKAEKNLVK